MKGKRTIHEWVGRGLVLLLLSGLISLLVVGRWYGRETDAGRRIELHARMPEDGGWIPGNLTVVAGQPLHLRLISDDVVHGFAIGQSDQPAIDLEPGKPVDLSLTFEQPGKYIYYCTRWCGANHWRMHGTIQVLPDESGAATIEGNQGGPAAPPLYVTLGLDIDAPHPAEVTPQARPSASWGGESLAEAALEKDYGSLEYIRAHSPANVWKELRYESALEDLTDGQIWDLVASLWQAQTTPERLVQGRDLYARNCAACHGERGAGDGVMADEIAAGGDLGASMGGMDTHLRQAPADFTDPQTMLGASPAILHGKIVRGGMGTGMPYWGPILTDEEIWAVVDFLWTFQFNMETNANGTESEK